MRNSTEQATPVQGQMKRFAVRKTETIKTTAAAYGGCCCVCGGGDVIIIVVG